MDADHLDLGNAYDVGVATEVGERHHAVADLEIFDVRANRVNFSGDLVANHHR